MADPDLSRTVPEKLPVAWPCKAGQMANKRAKATTKSEVLSEIIFVKPSIKCGHWPFLTMRFITTPFNNFG
jgi:hypothetical protein